ncbi:sigma-54-dependent Fis family transcriptional regulator [Aeromonas australiensis]|uniref:sigma-54 interaction domain-containing protein n=1 Tax=Aeromonas australiensis TaxID=1114880 RepID=UPI001F32EA5B|nr:sigma-54 dependent transcriptional regulator [Aeromonas australiensis]MCF3098690.1 sigma-54-dependent Fis family transcriptional regulator [Aeromonas australiensis]
MDQALAFALALTSQRDEQHLCHWWSSTLNASFQPKGLLLGMLDVSGRQLECKGWVKGQEVALALAVDDFSHPLAYVLHKAQSRTWDSLHGGARIEHAEFRALLANLGQQFGLHAFPLNDGNGKPFAVLAMMDSGDVLQEWAARPELASLAQVFCNQLTLIRDLGRSRRDQNVLRDSLRQIKGEGERQRQHERLLGEQLVGQSAVIRGLREQIAQAGQHKLTVLIQGETGSGKEVVARLVHQCSERAAKPFVAINCAAIPENLIESELFGYQKGAFSGALANKTGLVAQANGGTLFLDEVGDMPLAMQAKLLRVLETRSYRPLGAEQEYQSDFRLIAATHQPLTRHVEEGQFRADLYHRLCQCLLLIAPLRERIEDVPQLCQHFIAQFAAQDGKGLAGLQRKFLKQLQSYDFPGNVRELRNLLEVACAHTRPGEEVGLGALPPELRDRVCVELPDALEDYNHIRDLRRAMQQFEASVIEARLRYFQGNRMLVAESLNIPKRTLDHKCQKLEVN